MSTAKGFARTHMVKNRVSFETLACQLSGPRADITHVSSDVLAPPDGSLWTMYCGVQTFAFEDGTLTPLLDFYDDEHWRKATCKHCKMVAAMLR